MFSDSIITYDSIIKCSPDSVRKSSDALVAADKQVFFSLCAKVSTEQDIIRSSRGKLSHMTAAETANSLVPMAVLVR